MTIEGFIGRVTLSSGCMVDDSVHVCEWLHRRTTEELSKALLELEVTSRTPQGIRWDIGGAHMTNRMLDMYMYVPVSPLCHATKSQLDGSNTQPPCTH